MTTLDSKLEDVFLNKGFKLYRDEAGKGLKEDSWRYYELRGKRGVIYPYNETQLACMGYRKDGMSPTKFVDSKGYKILQDADDMLTFLFPVADFPIVSAKFQLKKKQIRSTSKEST